MPQVSSRFAQFQVGCDERPGFSLLKNPQTAALVRSPDLPRARPHTMAPPSAAECGHRLERVRAATTAPADRQTTHWLAVVAAVAAGFAIALNVGKVPVALPLLRAEGGFSLVQAGWVSSMLTTVAVFLAAAVGMWVGRVGALRMVLAGLVLCGAASMAAAWAGASWGLLMTSRFLEGVGFMLVAVSCPALVTAATGPRERRFALGLWSSYMPGGASLAMASAPWLLPRTGWRGLWLLTALFLWSAAAALWLLRRHYTTAPAPAPAPVAPPAELSSLAHDGPARRASSAPPAPRFFGPVKEALSSALPWLLALSFGVWATQHFALIVWLPTYLLEQRGFDGTTVALLTAGMLVACVPGNVMGGALVQRAWPRGLLMAAAQVCTGLGAWVYSSEGLPDGLRYAACVWVSFAGGVIPAAVMSSSSALAQGPQQVGTLQGLYTQGAQLGQFVGTPLIAATVAASGHWSSALWVTAPAALLGVALGLWSHRLELRRPGHNPLST
jgi:MFS transporter, CP family, cyanate transporter